jgi:putative acetyltransferase
MARTLHLDQLHAPDVAALLELHVAAMRGHSPADACHILAADALDRPDILFMTLRQDGELLAMGALKLLGTEGEIKSMRTAAAHLGTGAGRTMLEALISEARRRGLKRVRLETGRSNDFAAANSLYDSSGFVSGEPFGGYPESSFTRFLRLDL